MPLDSKTQAVESDRAGNAYVAGVVKMGVSYKRFVQKLDPDGAETWRFESSYTSAFSDIAHQQLIVDEADTALYVLRSNQGPLSHLISVAKHRLSDGGVIWNTTGGTAAAPLGVAKPAAFGLGTDNRLWIVRQYQTNFPFDGPRWTIQYRVLNATDGLTLKDLSLLGAPGKNRYLIDMAAADDRLFVASREQGPTDFELITTVFDISTTTPAIVNPEPNTPCSSAHLCRQEFTLDIPESTTGTATFTDAALDGQGNLAIAGYYERLIPDDCLPECYSDIYAYYPVVVKVNRDNRALLTAVEDPASDVNHSRYDDPSPDVTVSIAARGCSLFVLVAGRPAGGIVVEKDGDGNNVASWRLNHFLTETFSDATCSHRIGVWQPRALTRAPGERLIVTGQLPSLCGFNDPTYELDRARTVSFSDVGGTDDDCDGIDVSDGDCNDNDPFVFPGATEICDERDNDCDASVDEGFSLSCEHPLSDTDQDALPDKWERFGIDVTGDGTIEVDLPAMGASPLRKDVFVEVDHMEDTGPNNPHSDAFAIEALVRVQQAYLDAPVMNPDGSTGISLHIDAGPDSLMDPLTGASWGSLSQANALPHYEDTSLNAIPHHDDFSFARRAAFHYATAAHSLEPFVDASCSPAVTWRFNGVAQLSGKYFIVTQGVQNGALVDLGGFVPSVRDIGQQASLFMHELGHNMGLGHGGFNDHVNRKPHYFSVMNYSYSYRGLNIGGEYGHLDYNRYNSGTLDENSLDENVGINSSELLGHDLGTIRYCPYNGSLNCVADPSSIVVQEPDATAPMDWNCNGAPDETNVNADINLGPTSVLTATSDWDKLVYDGARSSVFLSGQSTAPEIPIEPSDKQLEALLPKPFVVKVSGNGIVMLSPGTIETFEFAILNDGDNPDTYELETSVSAQFAETSGVPSSVHLAPGGVSIVAIPVSINSLSARGDRYTVSLRARSQGNPQMVASASTVAIVSDVRPVAIPTAGAPNGDTVVLDASGSSSPSGAPLSYLWTGPFSEGDGARIEVTPTVTLPPGDHTITLVVNDGVVDSAAATIVVHIDALCPGPEVSVWHQCTTDCPCDDGKGDCDSDGECVAGARCIRNVGPEYGYTDPDVDVCLVGCPTGGAGTWDYCSVDCPCEAGQGDCDNDGECVPGLTCVKNVGTNYGWATGVDVCEQL